MPANWGISTARKRAFFELIRQIPLVSEVRSTDKPIVFGAPYSVYVRAVRLALEEKGVAYELVPLHIFAPGGPSEEHLQRHPFGKIPAFKHAGFHLYEAGAVTRYVDEAFSGPALQPADP